MDDEAYDEMRQLPLRQQLQLCDLCVFEAQVTVGGGCEASPDCWQR
jgi:hypothetical protein